MKQNLQHPVSIWELQLEVTYLNTLGRASITMLAHVMETICGMSCSSAGLLMCCCHQCAIHPMTLQGLKVNFWTLWH